MLYIPRIRYSSIVISKRIFVPGHWVDQDQLFSYGQAKSVTYKKTDCTLELNRATALWFLTLFCVHCLRTL